MAVKEKLKPLLTEPYETIHLFYARSRAELVRMARHRETLTKGSKLDIARAIVEVERRKNKVGEFHYEDIATYRTMDEYINKKGLRDEYRRLKFSEAEISTIDKKYNYFNMVRSLMISKPIMEMIEKMTPELKPIDATLQDKIMKEVGKQ